MCETHGLVSAGLLFCCVQVPNCIRYTRAPPWSTGAWLSQLSHWQHGGSGWGLPRWVSPTGHRSVGAFLKPLRGVGLAARGG